mmetsp:Transcript_1387/g.3223  ORF Transcript_1387/g.3223 Transcript_1387/m.3223 type:complete len:295 (-) Transcript_1387:1453-2337(-)
MLYNACCMIYGSGAFAGAFFCVDPSPLPSIGLSAAHTVDALPRVDVCATVFSALLSIGLFPHSSTSGRWVPLPTLRWSEVWSKDLPMGFSSAQSIAKAASSLPASPPTPPLLPPPLRDRLCFRGLCPICLSFSHSLSLALASASAKCTEGFLAPLCPAVPAPLPVPVSVPISAGDLPLPGERLSGDRDIFVRTSAEVESLSFPLSPLSPLSLSLPLLARLGTEHPKACTGLLSFLFPCTFIPVFPWTLASSRTSHFCRTSFSAVVAFPNFSRRPCPCCTCGVCCCCCCCWFCFL